MKKRTLSHLAAVSILTLSAVCSQNLAASNGGSNDPFESGPKTHWVTEAGAVDANKIYVRDASGRREMPYTHPKLMAMTQPMIGVRYELRLGNRGASLRTASGVPEFEMILPTAIQPGDVLVLAMFGETRDVERTLTTGSNKRPFPEGLTAYRTIPLDAKIAADQGNAPAGFAIYLIKPATLLDQGEYTLILSKGKGDVGDEVSYGPSVGFNVYEFAVE